MEQRLLPDKAQTTSRALGKWWYSVRFCPWSAHYPALQPNPLPLRFNAAVAPVGGRHPGQHV